MAERPILFSAPMVRALLAGTKTQTRRVVKLKPGTTLAAFLEKAEARPFALGTEHRATLEMLDPRCPYGVSGDRLIVRETFRLPAEYDDVKPSLVRSSAPVWYAADGRADDGWGKTRVSIHMPRWASRLTLRITDVRVERLNDISEADAKAEGITALPLQDPADPSAWWEVEPGKHQTRSPRDSYRSLWEHINGPGSWAANPWVWAVTCPPETTPHG